MNVEELQDANNDLNKQVLALREMVYQILQEVGSPVHVPYSNVKEPVTKDREILVNYDQDNDMMIFSIGDWYA